jgi:hypothetical protein
LADFSFADFQEAVSDCLIRHRSVLDVMTKFQEASSRVNRAVAKSVTSCGCTEVCAKRQKFPEHPEGTTLSQIKQFIDTHISGELCADCRDALENEVGRCLFYLVALCEITGVDFSEAVEREWESLRTLGVFNMS